MSEKKHRSADYKSKIYSRIYQVKNRDLVKDLFHGWEEALIWSCLQGTMGHIYADEATEPTAAMAILGDFCFFAGRPNKELVSFKPQWCEQDFIIMVPQNEEWGRLIEDVYGKKAVRVMRYATKKERKVFDINKLQQIVNIFPEDYSLQMIDQKLFKQCKEISWCRDLVLRYSTYEEYEKLGLGVVILKSGEIVSGASSYSSYSGGIEIEIDTREDFRRKGLASVCGAKLILECLKKGLYPSWDAQNKASLSLAEKLGYHFDHEYSAYEIYGY